MSERKTVVMEGEISIDMLIAPIRPFLKMVGDELMSSPGDVSLEQMVQAVDILADQVVSAEINQNDRSGSLAEISGLCSALAAQALWTSFVAMKAAEALKAEQDGLAQTARVH